MFLELAQRARGEKRGRSRLSERIDPTAIRVLDKPIHLLQTIPLQRPLGHFLALGLRGLFEVPNRGVNLAVFKDGLEIPFDHSSLSDMI